MIIGRLLRSFLAPLSVLVIFLLPINAFAAEALAHKELIDAQIEKVIEASSNISKSQATTQVSSNLLQYQKEREELDKLLDQAQSKSDDLQDVIDKYVAERQELLKVQTMLASGLIGVLFTAIIAIIGAVINVKNSRPERDLKRLAVIEKAIELKGSGATIPVDITSTYHIS